MNGSNLFIGLISGTSRDGVDAVLARIGETPAILNKLGLVYPPDLAQDLRDLVETRRRPAAGETDVLDGRLGEFFAYSVDQLLAETNIRHEDVRAIGSHGQTVWHEPTGDRPITIQLGSGQVIADQTRITCVADFRSADVRAGGEGAPLAPLLHRALLEAEGAQIALVNLGGIANVTLFGTNGEVWGWDTGPANCLLDGWISRHKALAYDNNGDWASQGRIFQPLLEVLERDPYFSEPPPKSTGVEYFNTSWLDTQILEHCSPAAEIEPADIQATLAELTAKTIASAIETHRLDTLLVCGGGVHNDHLMKRLGIHLPGVQIASSQTRGIPPDWVEALLFAWLAEQRLSEVMQDTRTITGASNPVLLGDIFNPQE